jgi:glucosamine 6-phosphate synthetase-like amidotransferase/phosphosugar isomerase protein
MRRLHDPQHVVHGLAYLPLDFIVFYHIAVRRGCDVDQPRNLAKSVTVEKRGAIWGGVNHPKNA